jgi:ectoine hydroxylase-related dioxygenase (phytanoyl-CoA dioxygenase family)
MMSALDRDGFQVVAGLLAPEEIGSLRRAIEDSIDRVARVMLTPYETSCPATPLEERIERIARQDRAYAAALLQVVMADAQHDARFTAITRHPSLEAAVNAVLAPDAPSGYVIRTRAAIPAFTSQISPWHQDVPRPHEGSGCAMVRVACWIPLSDVDEHTGALEVLPGAWKAPCRHEMSEDGHFSIPNQALPRGEPRVVPMRCGDVLLLDRFVPHRARSTRGLRGRWSVVIWVKTGGVRSPC